MINLIKVQQDCIKALVKGFKVLYYVHDKTLWISVDGYTLYAFPISDFFVEISKMQKVNISYIFENRCLSVPAKKTDTIKVFGKNNAVKFECDGKPHYMDEKYTKLCEKWGFYGNYFYGYDKNNIPVVVVMEVKVKVNE